MNKHISKLIVFTLAASAVAALTGCRGFSKCQTSGHGTCNDNAKAGIAVILCQPMDTTAKEDGKATFEVVASGDNLTYRWIFSSGNGTNVEIPNKNKPTLTLPHVTKNNVGLYWCEIESTNRWGAPVLTRTRSASLGVLYSITKGGPMVESQPFRRTSSTSCLCATNSCGYVLFGNGGKGYKATTTNCRAKLSLANGDVANTNYGLMWRLSGTQYDCFSNTDNPYKMFTSTVGGIYVFTGYFLNPCPAHGAPVTIAVEFN